MRTLNVDTKFMVSEKEWDEAEKLEHISGKYLTKWMKQLSLVDEEKRNKVLDKVMDCQGEPEKIAKMMEMSPEEILAIKDLVY